MRIFLVGLSHRTAPVAVRERYAVPALAMAGFDEKLVREPGIDEAALISTCNRTEIIGVGPDVESGLDALRRFLQGEIGDGGARPDQLYELLDLHAVEHVFEVASSLDSMVVGEAQILGQVKDAYRCAIASRSCGPVLNRLFQRAFRTGKRIRSETGLGAASVSVARVGVQLAQELFESFEGKRVLLLGAGEMGAAAAQGLRDAGVRDTVVVNRSREPAQRLAERLEGEVGSLDALDAELTRADVVIASVQADSPLLVRERLERALAGRAGRPVLLIDLGIPRNVDPDCQQVPGAYVYDLDDLEGVAQRGRDSRRSALAPARAIVEQERDWFERWLAGLPLVPTIRQLRHHVLGMVEAELRRTVSTSDGNSSDPASMTRLAEALAAKILHRPLERLHAEAENGTGPYYAEAVRRLFDLDEDDA